MSESAIMQVERIALDDALAPQRYPEGANVMARRYPTTAYDSRRGENCNLYKHGESAGRGQGQKPSAEYVAYLAMNQRCYYTKGKSYENYGGRGVRVADEWRGEGGFEKFLAHVGRKPSPSHSLDRYPNNDGNYEPGNVRWATRQEQSNNRRPRTKGFRHKNPRQSCRNGHPYADGCRQCPICLKAKQARADQVRREKRKQLN